ncbi:hypothetical protein WA158_002677 [Blastocystis sp. Blastoise]
MLSSLWKLKDTAFETFGIRDYEDKDILEFREEIKKCESNLIGIDSCINESLKYIRLYKTKMTNLLKLTQPMNKCGSKEEIWNIASHFDNSISIITSTVEDKAKTQLAYELLAQVEDELNLLEGTKERILECENSIKDFDINYSDPDIPTIPSLSQDTTDKLEVEVEENASDRMLFMIREQKKQLQQDIRDVKQKNKLFVISSLQKVYRIMHIYICFLRDIQSTLFDQIALSLSLPPPSELTTINKPLLDGREDAELEFDVSPGKTHAIPLEMLEGRYVRWVFYCEQDIGFGVAWKYVEKKNLNMNREYSKDTPIDITAEKEKEKEKENVVDIDNQHDDEDEEEAEELNSHSTSHPLNNIHTSPSAAELSPAGVAMIDIHHYTSAITLSAETVTSVEQAKQLDDLLEEMDQQSQSIAKTSTTSTISNVTPESQHIDDEASINAEIDSQINKEDTNKYKANTTLIVQPKRTIGGDGRHVIGSFVSPSYGMLVFEWDNTYSIFKTKSVYLRLSYRDNAD